MAKNLKLKVKNTQLAEALQLGKFKKPPVAKKKPEEDVEKKPQKEIPSVTKEAPKVEAEAPKPVAEKPSVPPSLPPKEKKEAPMEEAAKPVHSPAPQARPPYRRDTGRPTRLPFTRNEFKPEVKRAPPPKATPPPPPAAEKEKKTAFEEPKSTKKGFKEFRDLQPQRKDERKGFDARDRMGLRDTDEDGWRKKRVHKSKAIIQEDLTIRPKNLHVRLPITIKDLASEMKLKSSQLIAKLFMQGIVLTLNDYLDDETTVQLLGQEFECEIKIDKTEAERIKITDKTIKEEIASCDPESLIIRPPVVTFMGHVDHGKTSLIDSIRKTNMAAGEAGAITQHIGAFKCHTDVGDLTILDTPGHEAFSAMRARGAEVTDIVVLVIAGDEGMKDQTVEAINKAKEAHVPIMVAINKKDKPGFNAENVYRQLAEQELLPEVWGGTVITVNCSAVTGEGIKELLEMLALQAEVLELKANPSMRARGTVVESEMHKGLGPVASVLVQNGQLKKGDALVFDLHYARIKTMHDEFGKEMNEADPSAAVKITGLSGLPEAGSEFIVVSSEREAREIAHARQEEHKDKSLQKGKKGIIESFMQKKGEVKEKKVFKLILRADVQGSLEALKHSLLKIPSDKVEIRIISENVGQISESDIELAATSNATILGFHTQIEAHAANLINQKKVVVKLHDIIYHAVDDMKALMIQLLDKIPQENEMGTALVKAIFKSSHLGIIAGCMVTDGIIKRNHHMRLIRNKEMVWKGTIASLKRVKEDVREVTKGHECGIVLQNFKDIKEDDILQSFEITYLEQEL